MRDPLEAQGERTWKVVYTIVEWGPQKKRWVRIGVAFINRDQSITVKLDASPTNGQLHIRDPDPLPQRSDDNHGLALRPLEGNGAPSVNNWVMEGGTR